MTISPEKIRPKLIRNLSAVSLNKLGQVVGMVMTVAVIPRLFGAEDYGRFAFVLSLSFLGQILGDFGTLDMMGRFVPGMTNPEASRLYMRQLVFKVGVGLVCGLITVAAALSLGPWMRLDWAILTGLGVMLRLIAWIPFQFGLGLNRVGLWMAEQAWRQWAMLLLLLLLLPPFGLTGALIANTLMELIFCLLGLWAVRDYWQLTELRFEWGYLAPFIKFGLGFFMANLTTVALYRSGPLLIEILTKDSTQTGFFNLAIGLFLMVYLTASQFAQSLIPNLSDFYNRGEVETMYGWLQNFVLYGWLIGWAGIVLAWALTDWAAPLVFGAEFGPAAATLKWITLGMPFTALLWAGNVTATVTGRGRLKFGASLAALITFTLLSFGFVPIWGAVGAALALGIATLINVGVLTIYLYPDFKSNWATLTWSGATGVLLLMAVVWVGG